MTAGATGLGSIDASEAATFEPEVIEGCNNLDGQVVHDGVWWSANGALVRVDRVPDRWLSGEPIAGRIIVEGDTAPFVASDGPVLELRRYRELHCMIG